jgi:hypothetical protein
MEWLGKTTTNIMRAYPDIYAPHTRQGLWHWGNMLVGNAGMWEQRIVAYFKWTSHHFLSRSKEVHTKFWKRFESYVSQTRSRVPATTFLYVKEFGRFCTFQFLSPSSLPDQSRWGLLWLQRRWERVLRISRSRLEWWQRFLSNDPISNFSFHLHKPFTYH